MGTQENQSEITRFLQQWDEEVEAVKRGLHGIAITARHAFITRRMQSFGDEKCLDLMTLATKKDAQNSSSSSDVST